MAHTSSAPSAAQIWSSKDLTRTGGLTCERLASATKPLPSLSSSHATLGSASDRTIPVNCEPRGILPKITLPVIAGLSRILASVIVKKICASARSSDCDAIAGTASSRRKSSAMNSQKYRAAMAEMPSTKTVGTPHRRFFGAAAPFVEAAARFIACPQLAQKAASLAAAAPHDAQTWFIRFPPTQSRRISVGKAVEKGWKSKTQASNWRSKARTSLSISLSC